LLLIVLFWPILAQAEIGFSVYSLLSPSHPCKNTLHLIRKFKPKSIQFLAFDFGKSTKCLAQLPSTIQLVAILSNESCRRSHRCGKGSFLGQYSVSRYDRILRQRPTKFLPDLRKRLKAINALGRNFTKPVIVSLGLEDNLSATASTSLLNAISEVRVNLNLEYLSNVYLQNPESCICFDENPSVLCECHNPWLWETIAISSPAGCVINNDGWIYTKPWLRWGADLSQLHSAGYWFQSSECHRYLWVPSWNCRPANGWLEPWGRDCSDRGVPDSLIRSLIK
jgi:hypothetical protein